jgi:hypothetical protein
MSEILGESPWTINIRFYKMKDRRENRPFLEWIPVEVERAQGKGK